MEQKKTEILTKLDKCETSVYWDHDFSIGKAIVSDIKKNRICFIWDWSWVVWETGRMLSYTIISIKTFAKFSIYICIYTQAFL
jgi:membrane-anchored protein YejM (alkaline phosphatase superfamily)